jgi:4-amino-4-deoxy-L-arabinose transferase-like glycosyltransferase
VALTLAGERLLPSQSARFAWLKSRTEAFPFLLAALLVLHAAVWAWFGAASRSNFDYAGDMVETFAWGQAWQAGYFKHPPLSAWYTGAWFAIFPRTDLSYAWLASANTAVGLAGFALLCREFLDRRWTLACVAAAALTPGLTAMALRFNANAVLVSVWPLAMAFFVRAMNRGLTRDAIAAGLLCGLAMLGKYFSAMMLGALLLSALLNAPWRARLFSRTGFCIAAAFAVSLIPHGLWLMGHDFEPIRYAREATGFNTESATVRGLQFAGRMLLFPALGLLLLWLTVRPQIRLDRFAAIVGKCLRPSTDPLWILALAPIVLSVVMTTITAARTSTLWGLPMGMALVLLVASRLSTASSSAPHLRPAGLLLGVSWMAMAIAAPLYWHAGADRGDPTLTEPRLELAQAVDELWTEEVGTRLPWVSGPMHLAASTAFYAPSGPGYISFNKPERCTPWVDANRVERDGRAIICTFRDSGCIAAGESLGGRTYDLTVRKSAGGRTFEPVSYSVVIVAPAARSLGAAQ